MEWSFSNKVSAIPQFLSFKTSQEDRPRKSVNDPLVSSGFMPISTSDAFDSKQRLYYGAFQVCFDTIAFLLHHFLPKSHGNYSLIYFLDPYFGNLKYKNSIRQEVLTLLWIVGYSV